MINSNGKFSRNLFQTYNLNALSKIFKFSNAHIFQEPNQHEFLPYLQAWSRLAEPIHSPSGQTNARIRGNDLKTSKLLPFSSPQPILSAPLTFPALPFSPIFLSFSLPPVFPREEFLLLIRFTDTRHAFKRGNQESIEAFLFRLPPLVSTPLDCARAPTIPVVFLFTTVVSLRSCFNYFSSLLFLLAFS